MFGNREVHRKLSGTGGYAAGRLAEISESLGQLAKVMKNSGEDPGLSREDGIAALESAASMVCGSCDRCGMKQECLEDQDGENYFLYYLLRSFEKKGALEYPDMPREFLDRCRKKTDYLQELNRSLGRSTMNLAWKNRFLESRDAVMLQFEEMAGILGEFSGQMEQAADVTEALVPAVRAAFRKRRIALEDMLVLKYGDGRREAFLTARTGNGRCVTVKDMAALFGQAVGRNLSRRGMGRRWSRENRPWCVSSKREATGSCLDARRLRKRGKKSPVIIICSGTRCRGRWR